MASGGTYAVPAIAAHPPARPRAMRALGSRLESRGRASRDAHRISEFGRLSSSTCKFGWIIQHIPPLPLYMSLSAPP